MPIPCPSVAFSCRPWPLMSIPYPPADPLSAGGLLSPFVHRTSLSRHPQPLTALFPSSVACHANPLSAGGILPPSVAWHVASPNVRILSCGSPFCNDHGQEISRVSWVVTRVSRWRRG